jgi:putative sugar O-methyltransferase
MLVSCRNGDLNHTPRCIYDHAVFAEISSGAAENEQQFLQFKKAPFFNLLWENLSFEEGELWLHRIEKESPFLKEKFEQFRQIDRIGSPRTYSFGDSGIFSPSTLRLIAMTGDLQIKLKDAQRAHIIQIGAGYGSWCKILNDVLGFKSYTLVDLPEQLALAKKCLETLEVQNVEFLTPEELPKAKIYDLVISDMSFSEFNRSYQELFFDKILSCSSSGYILGHLFPKHYGVVSMNLDELKLRFDKIGNFTEWEMQEPSNYRDNYFIYWTIRS